MFVMAVELVISFILGYKYQRMWLVAIGCIIGVAVIGAPIFTDLTWNACYVIIPVTGYLAGFFIKAGLQLGDKKN